MAWFNKFDHATIVSLLKLGCTTTQIGRAINRPRASVARYCTTNNLRGPGFIPRGAKRSEYWKVPEFIDDYVNTIDIIPNELPSHIRPSMRALAEFDPVIMRALKVRLRMGV